MKTRFATFTLLSALLLTAPLAFSQYSGGSGDGYVSSRSDDILYEGTTPIVTGEELPDVVHHLTINNPAGVTLSKNIMLTGTLSVLNGDFNLNGNVITLDEYAMLVETPGNIIIGGGGNLTVTRTLNDLTQGQNVANLGLTIKTEVPLGSTTIARGNELQQINPNKISTPRFYDVSPTNNENLDATVEFHYDDSEIEDVPEADLALFISHDAVALASAAPVKGLAQISADPTWEFLGGNVVSAAKTISKGGVGGFSRLAIARGYVLFADQYIKIESNKFSQGDIHSNGKIIFDKGNRSKHTGNLTAVTDIEIEKYNTIDGNVYAGTSLDISSRATVTGEAIAPASVASIGLPTPVFTAPHHGKVKVPRKGTLTLPPGDYGEIEVDRSATLYLTSGDYYIDELEVDDGAVISIDIADGPVNINVVSKLEFEKEVEINITPEGPAASNQVTFTTLQHKEVKIGDESLIQGWLIAPNAEVDLREECVFKGSIVAKAISVEEKVILVPHSYTSDLPRPKLSASGEVEATEATITDYELSQNYPNPFNPSTTIRFSLPQAGAVQLAIYNITGQEVRRLVSGAMNAGRHSVVWDGKDNSGQSVPSGIYFYRLHVNDFVHTRKMSFVK